MKTWTLDIILSYYDHFVKDVDFGHLPARESEEYRQLLLQTANDVVFADGRISPATEYMIEIFDDPEVVALTHDLTAINQLEKAKRLRLAFYLDLGEVCYPLLRGQQMDWTAWPWLMKDASSSMDNDELFDVISSGQRPCLEAAMLYNLKQQVWMDSNGQYTCVARQEVADAFNYDVDRRWKEHDRVPEELAELASAVNECANKMWQVENHMQVGRLLGFDWLTQSVYDAFDTFIDTTYRHRQVVFARELASWMHDHVPTDVRPEQAEVDAFYNKMQELMAKHSVSSPDFRYTWSILTMDVLEWPTSDEQDDEEGFDEEDFDLDNFDDEDFGKND